MRRKILAVIAAALLTAGALACDGGVKPECSDGAVKVEVRHGKSRTYHCYNGEWVRQ